MEKYDHPGDYVVGTITKARNATHLQLSLSEFGGINEKEFRIGQTFPAEVKSKEELGCHLVAGSIKYKIFLQKSAVTEAAYEALQESKQIIVVITQTEEAKRLLKVSLANESEIVLNLRDVDEGEMSKLELEQYLCPGTLINTKIVKVLQNGVLVKFLKVFTGFIHADHLNNRLSAYVVDEKILARVIFRCANPPAIYLSQRHVLLTPYSPSH